MTNKLDAVSVLKDALEEAQKAVSKAQCKVDRTQDYLERHLSSLRECEEVLAGLNNAIELIEPSTTRPEPILPTHITDEEIAKMLDPRVVDKEIYDPFGYGQDTPLADIKVGACITCGSNAVTCGCNQVQARHRV